MISGRLVLRWVGRLIVAYLLLVLLFGLALLTPAGFNMVDAAVNRFEKPTYTFWEGGELYSDPPSLDLPKNAFDRLSRVEPASIGEAGVFVLLLDGLPEIKSIPFAKDLGLNVDSIASSETDSMLTVVRVGLNLRFHPLPFAFERRTIVVVDKTTKLQQRGEECFAKIVFAEMIDSATQPYWSVCEEPITNP